MTEAAGTGIRAEDDAACRELLRRGSKSFHAAGRLLPRRLRAPVAATYAFCRVADDAIDTADSPAAGLDGLRRRLERICGGDPEDHPIDRAFSSVVRRFRIPRAVPEALLEGFLWDVERRRYDALADVRAYSARVASTVAVMMALIMEQRRPHVLARACDLGVAMQLTNIARDVGEDARQGRLYLPRTWLAEAGVDADAFLATPRHSPKLGVVVERLLGEADDLYLRAVPGIPFLPEDCRPAIRAARWVYADIGRAIRANGHDSVSRRAATTLGRKVRLLLRARWSRRARAAEAVGVGVPPLAETAFLVKAVRDQDAAAAKSGP